MSRPSGACTGDESAGPEPARLAGEVVATGDARLPAGARLLVHVEEASRADGAAVVIATVSLEVPASAGERLPFSFDVELPAVGTARYLARVHVDTDGDGRITVGDWVSFRSHRVPSDGPLVIPVRLVD